MCCIPPARVVEYCPNHSKCVPKNQCFTTAWDEQEVFAQYHGVHADGFQECSLGKGYPNGVCCTPNYVNCPHGSTCAYKDQCFTTAWDQHDVFTQYSGAHVEGFQECSLGTNLPAGVCCTPNYVNCPPGSTCAYKNQCFTTAWDQHEVFTQYSGAHVEGFQECSLGSNLPAGVCCTPNYVNCPHGSSCVYKNECFTTAWDQHEVFSQYSGAHIEGFQECSLGSGLPAGVCCTPKFVDCPHGSSCADYGHCVGTAMKHDGGFFDFDPLDNWAECSLGEINGICCKSSLLAAAECGHRNYQIDQKIQADHAHNEAAFGEFPWQAIIFFANYTFKCGASIIDNQHILTAAHCVRGLHASDIRIRLGEWKVNGFDEPLPYDDYDAYKIWIHPEFNPKNLHNNVGVIELKDLIPLQYHINSVCLPHDGWTVPTDYRCFTSGWGKDSFTGNNFVIEIKIFYVINIYFTFSF